MSTEVKSCFDCRNFELCRLRDKAREFRNYFNETGNYMDESFPLDLYELMGTHCSKFEIEPDEK